jgi:hypothetical protein
MSDRYIDGPTPSSMLRRVRNRLERAQRPKQKSEEEETNIPDHLARGNKQIFACVIESEKGELPKEIVTRIERAYARPKGKVQYEDQPIETIFSASPNQEERLAFVEPNSSDKISTEFRNCVGLVVVGKRKATGKQVSFVFHASPDEFVFSDASQQMKVRNAIRERLAFMKQKCESGSIDAILVGGNDPTGDASLTGALTKDDYRTLVEAYGSVVQGVLGFEPAVIVPPLQEAGDTHLYFETATRRVFLYKDARLPDVTAFRASEVGSKEDAWRKRRKKIR